MTAVTVYFFYPQLRYLCIGLSTTPPTEIWQICLHC